MQDKPIFTDVTLIKIDKDTNELIKSDFSFGIYEDKECTKLIAEVKSDKETATALFKDLRYSTIYIKELSAPKGYQLSDKVLELTINDKGVFLDGTELTKENDIYSFEFENQKLPRVQTGNETNYILLISIAIISILVIIVGIDMIIKNRKSLKQCYKHRKETVN